MTKNSLPKPVASSVDFHYGRSLIYTIRRHGAGQSEIEARETAERSSSQARNLLKG